MFNYCWFEYHIPYFINKSTVQTVCAAWFASRATTDLLTYSGGTDIPNELCFNFSISDYFTEIVNFPALRGCDCQICLFWFWYLFYSSFPSIWKFWSCCCSVSIDLPSNLKSDATCHRPASDYSCADWDGLCDNLRDFW